MACRLLQDRIPVTSVFEIALCRPRQPLQANLRELPPFLRLAEPSIGTCIMALRSLRRAADAGGRNLRQRTALGPLR